MEDSKKSKIPYSIPKQKLYTLCFPVPENTVKKRINEIIFENRSKNYPEYKDKPRLEIVRCVFVERVELIEYFTTYGLPDGIEF